MSKEELIGALSEAHDSLLVAADVAVTRGDLPGAGWGLREVLGHIAAWDAEAIERIPALVAGAPSKTYDADAFNAAAVAALGERSLGEVRADLEQVHSRLVSLLDGLDEEAFTLDGVAYGSRP